MAVYDNAVVNDIAVFNDYTIIFKLYFINCSAVVLIEDALASADNRSIFNVYLVEKACL